MATTTSQNNHTLEVVEVPFYGDSIEAARNTQDGSVHVSIRRVCENLGIDFSTQLQKLKSYHWACVGMIPTRDQLERQQELACLPLTQVPAWLTHIDPNKVGSGPELVEKLKRYQLEAVDVLYKHFVGLQTVSQDPLVVALQSCLATRQAQLVLEAQFNAFEQRTDDRLDKVEQQTSNVVALRTAALNVLTELPRSSRPAKPLSTRAKVNMLIRQWANAHGVEMIAKGEAGDVHEVHSLVYQRMYFDFKYRYGFDARLRSAHSGRSKLDEIELANKMEDFFDMVSELLS